MPPERAVQSPKSDCCDRSPTGCLSVLLPLGSSPQFRRRSCAVHNASDNAVVRFAPFPIIPLAVVSLRLTSISFTTASRLWRSVVLDQPSSTCSQPGIRTNTKYTWEHDAANGPTPEQVLMRAKPLPVPCPPSPPVHHWPIQLPRGGDRPHTAAAASTRQGGDFLWGVAQRLH